MNEDLRTPESGDPESPVPGTSLPSLGVEEAPRSHRDGLRRLGQAGYTWIELVFAAAIIGIVVSSSVMVYKTISRSYWQVDEKSQLERYLVFTMDQMVQEIRQARNFQQLSDVKGLILQGSTVHLDAAGTTVCTFSIPNMTNTLEPRYDAQLTFFLKERVFPGGLSAPTTCVQLFQRMKYYNGTWTESFPAMASVDQYRLGKPRATPVVEPAPGTATPTPTTTASPSPTPALNNQLGKMAGVYESSRYSFDDVSFYYDTTNQILAVGVVVSLRSKSLSWLPSTTQRRRLTLTTSVALRNLITQ